MFVYVCACLSVFIDEWMDGWTDFYGFLTDIMLYMMVSSLLGILMFTFY